MRKNTSLAARPVPIRLTRRALASSAVVAIAVLAGCGSDDDASGQDAGVSDPANTSEPGSGSLSIEEAWVQSAESGMSAAFGTFVNDAPQDIRIVSATTASSPVMELHEVVIADGGPAMREKEDGFTVPAEGEHLLEPGADHLMLMDVITPIQPGDDVDFILTLDTGETFEFTAQAKEFSGADEEYLPGEGDHHGHQNGDEHGHEDGDHADDH
ncbi:copper chaperone PCu(A)C [Phytoactinopolyspora mesophila]|uniref:Copper chaperone PCu(A)C n=1 Tax=Phytoactinopolyspora mesophila TaxID=2650750 RepID=A0A7K3M988_9ACTN|nr:copper chaperone PCu(A)C [Phytoactinopolyspora mesophila]NDL59843.1 copper chaperone PCu(A)C [Phytoactinopolyspora mesophila]